VIWLTWRQHRLEALGSALVLVVLVVLVVAVVTAAQPVIEQIRHACPGGGGGDSCGRALSNYEGRFYVVNQIVYLAFLAVPVLSGLFVGAPLLARELEHGTDQLVWSQGITRGRWLLIKLAVLAAATVIIAGILAVTGYESSSARPDMLFNKWSTFDTQGPEFVAYALFSFALGVAASSLIGRTVPAMAAVLVGFVGARLAVGLFARRGFLPPLEWDVTTGIPAAQLGQNWTIGTRRNVDLSGHAISDEAYNRVFTACARVGKDPDAFRGCLHDQGVMVVQSYQPADRFALFQGIETAIFIVAAIALLGLSVWLVRRRA
jgi:hypothetical protein